MHEDDAHARYIVGQPYIGSLQTTDDIAELLAKIEGDIEFLQILLEFAHCRVFHIAGLDGYLAERLSKYLGQKSAAL